MMNSTIKTGRNRFFLGLLGEIETFGAAMAFRLSKFHPDLDPQQRRAQQKVHLRRQRGSQG